MTPVERLNWLSSLQSSQTVTVSAMRVAVYLAITINSKTGLLNPSLATIGRETLQPKRTVQRAISNLINIGALIELSAGNGKGNTTQYSLNMEVKRVTAVTPIKSLKGDSGDAKRVTAVTAKGDSGDQKPDLLLLDEQGVNKGFKQGDQNPKTSKNKNQNSGTSKTFKSPPQIEVLEYMKTKSFENPENESGKFCDFYASKGWMVGKNKMRDWRAAVRNWERNQTPPRGAPQGGETRSQFADRATNTGERLKQNLLRATP